MSDTVASAPSAAELWCWKSALAQPSPAVDDAERVERIRHLEELKAALAAAQARESAAFADSQRAEQAAAPACPDNVPPGPDRIEQSIAPRWGWRGGVRRSRPAATWAGHGS